MAGFFHYRAAETVDDDLTARALVLDDGATRLAIVVCDLISLKANIVAVARARISEMYGIPPERVMISCTHTHTGPVTSENRGVQPDQAYMEWLPVRIADAVGIACSRLAPAQVAYGSADVSGVCFNRRFRMRDGTVVFNPGVGNPDIIEPAGPTDPQVTTLLVEDTSGTPLAVWACLSTHYVGTDHECALSADYYGYFADAIRRGLGERCVGILANGTSGNINTIDVHQVLPLKGTARARLVGTAVAAAAIQGVMTRGRHQDVILEGQTMALNVTRWNVTADDIALAEAIMAQPAGSDVQPAARFSYVVGQPIPAPQVRPYASGMLDLARLPDRGETELQVMRIGDFALVALPGEIFVEFGLTIKAESPFDTVAVVGLANDHIGYVPTEEAFRQGGYETWRTPTSWSAPGTGEAMTGAVISRLKEMRKGDAVATARAAR
jgi:hypothetical protein